MGPEEEWVAAIKEHGDNQESLVIALHKSLLGTIQRNKLRPVHIFDLIVTSVGLLAIDNHALAVLVLDELHRELLKTGPFKEPRI